MLGPKPRPGQHYRFGAGLDCENYFELVNLPRAIYCTDCLPERHRSANRKRVQKRKPAPRRVIRCAVHREMFEARRVGRTPRYCDGYRGDAINAERRAKGAKRRTIGADLTDTHAKMLDDLCEHWKSQTRSCAVRRAIAVA